MNAMALSRPTELNGYRVRLANGPAAAAEARRQVRAAICAWDLPVDADVAALLTSELVTNAIRHEAGETITLAVTCSDARLRVDVHDTSRSWPVLADVPAEAETGRGLMLAAALSADWGVRRTPAGKAVYFVLAFQPDLPRGRRARREGITRGDCERPRQLTVPTGRTGGSRRPTEVAGPAASPRRNGAPGGLPGDVGP